MFERCSVESLGVGSEFLRTSNYLPATRLFLSKDLGGRFRSNPGRCSMQFRWDGEKGAEAFTSLEGCVRLEPSSIANSFAVPWAGTP